MAARPKPLRRPTAPEGGWEPIFHSLPEGVVAVDAEGLVVAMNQAAEQLTGCSLASARGRHHRQTFARSSWLSELIEGIGGDRGGIRADGEISSQWGRPTPVRASASPILDSRGRRAGTAILLQDLSVQAGLEADQQRARSLTHLGAVVAGLAHEIKNPLSGIRGAVQLLGREIGPDAEGAEYIQLVLREVDRLTQLLEQLLRLGARGPLEISAVNVHEVIEHVLSLSATEARAGRVRVLRLFDPSLPTARGNRDLLIQVILNLVRNAIQAMSGLPPDSPRELRVATRIETDYLFTSPESGAPTRFLRVDVEDTGPGIPTVHQGNLFSPFFTTKPKGTGLGLAISHRIVSDLGGTIRFESDPGKTLFHVTLPVWREPTP